MDEIKNCPKEYFFFVVIGVVVAVEVFFVQS